MQPNLPIFTVLLISFLSACSPPEVEESLKDAPYFDLPAFLDKHSQKLTDDAGYIQKTIYLQSSSEVKMQPVTRLIDLLDELDKFNLNRSAYAGVFKDTTLKVGGNLYELRYQPRENNSIPIRSFRIFYVPDSGPDSIKAMLMHRDKHNFLYNSYEIAAIRLKYDAIHSVTLQSHQRILFFEPNRFKVVAEKY